MIFLISCSTEGEPKLLCSKSTRQYRELHVSCFPVNFAKSLTSTFFYRPEASASGDKGKCFVVITSRNIFFCVCMTLSDVVGVIIRVFMNSSVIMEKYF